MASTNTSPEQTSNNSYNIPLRYRKMENLHIVFWLFKDVAWCMVWRPLGIAMIFPTRTRMCCFDLMLSLKKRRCWFVYEWHWETSPITFVNLKRLSDYNYNCVFVPLVVQSRDEFCINTKYGLVYSIIKTLIFLFWVVNIICKKIITIWVL